MRDSPGQQLPVCPGLRTVHLCWEGDYKGYSYGFSVHLLVVHTGKDHTNIYRVPIFMPVNTGQDREYFRGKRNTRDIDMFSLVMNGLLKFATQGCMRFTTTKEP